MRYYSDGKPKNEGICSLKVRLSCMLHAVVDRLPRIGARRAAAVLIPCILCFAATARLNLALAVSVDGDFVGYAASRSQVDTILDRVRATSADITGGADPAFSVKCRLAVGKAEADIAHRMENKIYDVIDNIVLLSVVYADGEPVCAFSSPGDAASAICELISEYVNENTVSARFAEQVTVLSEYACTDMLEGNIKSLRQGLTVLTDEYTATEQAIKYSTNYILDESMLESEAERLCVGQNGVSRVEYRISRANGKLVSYEEADSSVVLEPVTAVVRVGTVPSYSEGYYIWPSNGCISSRFGLRNSSVGSRNHTGIDIAADYGDPIWASDGGEVIFADTYGGYGKLVKIRHDNGDVTYYAHCSELLVAEDDIVQQGQTIAHMGSTGVSSGVHVHFEIRPGGDRPANPELYLPEGVLPDL